MEWALFVQEVGCWFERGPMFFWAAKSPYQRTKDKELEEEMVRNLTIFLK
jgi:hypothetical protein